jgi:hypothetical protein
MTRFLKREKWLVENIVFPDQPCQGCAMNINHGAGCLMHFIRPMRPAGCYLGIYILVPRPPDGTRCRDLDGNIKVVGRDV